MLVYDFFPASAAFRREGWSERGRLERVSQGWDRDAHDDLIFKSSAKPWSEIWSCWPSHHHGSKRIHSEIKERAGVTLRRR